MDFNWIVVILTVLAVAWSVVVQLRGSEDFEAPGWGALAYWVNLAFAAWNAGVAAYQQHPVLMDYMPLTPDARWRLNELADLQPRVLAAMHGSTFVGDGAAALVASGEVIRQVTGVSATV